jgi:glycosyltransferase involved in cell wall biosynthesis
MDTLPTSHSEPTKGHVVHVVATNNFAGVERYVTYVAPLLVESGWRVSVIGGATEPMQRALGPHGIHHEPFITRQQIRAWLRTNAAEFHMVHAHMTDAELAAVAGVRGTRVPVIATRHFAQRRGSTRARRVALRWVGRRLAEQVSISQFVADSIGEPSRVIRNGVPDAEMGTHTEQVVLVAQRLEREKSTDVALRAFAASGLAAQGWQLHIAGTGSEEPALRHLAHQLGLTGSVTFLGFVNDVPDRLGRAGIVMAPCSVDAFGLTVAEAMACGAPVCAANTGGHWELFAGLNPAVFEPGDVFGAANALRMLASDSSARANLGARLRMRQRTDFSLTQHVAQLDALYSEVAAT